VYYILLLVRVFFAQGCHTKSQTCGITSTTFEFAASGRSWLYIADEFTGGPAPSLNFGEFQKAENF